MARRSGSSKEPLYADSTTDLTKGVPLARFLSSFGVRDPIGYIRADTLGEFEATLKRAKAELLRCRWTPVTGTLCSFTVNLGGQP